MGNSSVIYLFIFLPCAALQSLSLLRVSGLGGGPLEFGTRQTSYFLAEPLRAFEDEEGMERRGDAGRLRTRVGCRAEFPPPPNILQVVLTFPSREETSPFPKELDSGETKWERKSWKKQPSRGPTANSVPCASSWRESDSSRGLCMAVCRWRHAEILLLEEFSTFCWH